MLRRTVWRFEIPMEIQDGAAKWNNRFTIKMPAGAEVLTIQVQGSKPCIWAKVDPEQELTDRSFMLVGTGHPLPIEPQDFVHYKGTFQLAGGALVFHLFDCQDIPF